MCPSPVWLTDGLHLDAPNSPADDATINELSVWSFRCCAQEEFSHPVESLALTVDEVINVRRVLVKAEMEKFLQSKELYSNLKKGKVQTHDWVCRGIELFVWGRGFVENWVNVCVCFRFAAAAGWGFLFSRGPPPVSCAKGEKFLKLLMLQWINTYKSQVGKTKLLLLLF